jgi:LDH2 family malate/lactate/ureidoglycolate dehydrogenase
VPLGDLRVLCEAAAVAAGFAAGDARVLTDALIAGSLRSLPGQGQGVQSLPKYLERVRDGVIDPRAEIEEVSCSAATRLLDAHRAHGAIAATRAIELAIGIAADFGIGAVGVRNSTHLGVAGYFAALAAERDCIGIALTNAAPEIAPWGGTRATVGTNPMAIAVPSRQGWPVVLDMATATSGKGMIRWHQLMGLPIPSDWALTKQGSRTTNPVDGLAGTLYPVGGPKGYALAVLVDLLTGALTGSAVGLECFGLEHQDVGHLLLAIQIEAFVPLEEFLDRVERLIEEIRSSPLADGAGPIRVPGELEAQRTSSRAGQGVPIPADRFDELLTAAASLGLDADLISRIESCR